MRLLGRARRPQSRHSNDGRTTNFVTSRWFGELPDQTRLEVIRAARGGELHSNPSVAAASVEWARRMGPGGVGYSLWSWVLVAVDTVLAVFGFGVVGQETLASDRIAAKRIVRIASPEPAKP
ncbi:MAG: hypothetical protein JWQ66_4663 [Mucilaginibacter sp.]|nr:hypothetical protein [Mucilaginibacter sp.]